MNTPAVNRSLSKALTAAANNVIEKYARANPVEIDRGDPLKWLVGDSYWHAIKKEGGTDVLNYENYLLTWFLHGVKINLEFSFNEKTASILPMKVEHVASGYCIEAYRDGNRLIIQPRCEVEHAKSIEQVFVYLSRIIYGTGSG